ncbi:MAG: hypothetical protein QF903_03795 [Planctomycetota bacterium]|jgi:hypothetical protein|nr:hypothetical protein [Planctomycetota bacterium]MDP6761344.1 hypothetical protein [Planctomycetota bacterium]MDP6988580.1 hypothetical protein [Planctomycetota bacterium]
MPPPFLYRLGKFLEGVGLLVILVGLSMSIGLGFEDEGLASMASEFRGLMLGGGLFALGYLLERVAGGRS